MRTLVSEMHCGQCVIIACNAHLFRLSAYEVEPSYWLAISHDEHGFLCYFVYSSSLISVEFKLLFFHRIAKLVKRSMNLCDWYFSVRSLKNVQVNTLIKYGKTCAISHHQEVVPHQTPKFLPVEVNTVGILTNVTQTHMSNALLNRISALGQFKLVFFLISYAKKSQSPS